MFCEKGYCGENKKKKNVKNEGEGENERNIMIWNDPLKTFFASSAVRLEKRFSFTYMEMVLQSATIRLHTYPRECLKKPFSFRRSGEERILLLLLFTLNNIFIVTYGIEYANKNKKKKTDDNKQLVFERKIPMKVFETMKYTVINDRGIR